MRGKPVSVVAVAFVLAAAPAFPQPVETSPLAISGARPDAQGGTLTITGTGFGSTPFVTLDLVPLIVRSATDVEIVANAPISLMPPGDYILTVSRGSDPGDHASLDVALHGGVDAGGSSPADRSATGPGRAPAGGRRAADDTDDVEGPGLAATPDAVAATVGDRIITVAEVDREWRRQDPGGFIALAREIHDTRWRFTDELVAEELIAREAEAQGLTPQELMEREIPPRVVEMPESAAQSLYADLGTSTRGYSYERMKPALRAWLERVTARELARMNYLEELIAISTNAELTLDPPRIAVERTAQDAVLGPADAPVELVVFGDFQNADYGRFATAFGRVRETYGDRIRIVFKHLPPPDRTAAIQAAQAGQCANHQNLFWPFHDALLSRPAVLNANRLRQAAVEAGLDTGQFSACLTSGETRPAIMDALDEAIRYGLHASPGFLVNGRLAPEPPPFLPPFEYFTRLIEEALLQVSRDRR
ncbi:MAG: thioredoxin domain-containing protein [Acidobacteria bacterium]|nr:thioredoxin domain-containing protein [Acidobacteriota bacterium]